MKSVKEKDELKEIEEFETDNCDKAKVEAIELSDEEQDAITGGAASPYKKKKTLKEVTKRLF